MQPAVFSNVEDLLRLAAPLLLVVCVHVLILRQMVQCFSELFRHCITHAAICLGESDQILHSFRAILLPQFDLSSFRGAACPHANAVLMDMLNWFCLYKMQHSEPGWHHPFSHH